ncbi:MAG: hypothetical protein N3D72_04220, partial [Candidatus Methanomethyliaceae archaeon]|nr:hypothetical protein [Candidatus Methanomethyliaceae archaeon]
EGLCKIGKLFENVGVLTGDVAKPTCTYLFQEKYPNRFFNLGIGEQDIIGVAAGLALSGDIPIVALFASFLMRAWEQIRNTVSRANLNVKLIGTHAGLTAAADGASHQALEDIALMRVLPKMTIIVPGDPQETIEAIEAMVRIKGPTYLRIGKDETTKLFEGEGVFKIGRAVTLKDGRDVALISTGTITSEALKAAKCSEVDASVIHVPTIKPLDRDAIISAAKSCGIIICIEEHSTMGGLGGAIAELLSSEYPVPIIRIGVQDSFGESGSYYELLRKFGLTAENIRLVMKEAIKRK